MDIFKHPFSVQESYNSEREFVGFRSLDLIQCHTLVNKNFKLFSKIIPCDFVCPSFLQVSESVTSESMSYTNHVAA